MTLFTYLIFFIHKQYSTVLILSLFCDGVVESDNTLMPLYFDSDIISA